MLLILLFFLIFCAILGYIVLSSVPSLLHTPLMSGMNALSGITIIGGLYIYSVSPNPILKTLSVVALIFAMINISGGFWITERMLRMFKQDKSKIGD